MTRKLWLAVALALSIAGPARADYVIKDGNGASQTIKAFTCSGKICPGMTPQDTTGAAFGVSGNPFYVAFPSAQPVTGTFWQATQPVSAASWPLPTGAATQTTLAAILTQLTYGQATMANSLPVVIASNQGAIPVSGTFWQATQPISAASLPLPAGAAQDTTVATTNTDLGPPGATACATDTGSCSLNALIQRLAQRLTSIITALGSPMQQTGGSVTANAGTNLNTSALALDTSVGTTNTNLGAPGATACSTDTASCSLNALLQRIAQRVTSLITALGTPMQSSGGTVTPVAATTGGCTPYHLSGGTGASTNSNSIKASAAGTLCDLTVLNTTAVTYYLKVYDSAAAPTCSSATNIKHVYPIPSSASSNGAGLQRSLPLGEAYANGIGFCVTGGGGDTDNTNAATGVYIEASYK